MYCIILSCTVLEIDARCVVLVLVADKDFSAFNCAIALALVFTALFL